MIVYISIGNSDDKLAQREWALYCDVVDKCVRKWAGPIHGAWLSLPNSEWQNACWCVEVSGGFQRAFKEELRVAAHSFQQDSIAWAEAPTTEFLSPTEASQ